MQDHHKVTHDECLSFLTFGTYMSLEPKLNQIFLMNGRIQKIQANVQDGSLTIESLKHRENTKKKEDT